MKKGILMTLFGAFVFINYLVLTIKSYSYYNDGWGKDIALDQDLVVKTIVGLILLICGIVVLIKIKKRQDTFNVYNTSIGTVGVMMFFYPLGLMFKMISKKKSGDVIVDYLIWAIFGAFILAYAIISYIEYRKKLA